MERTENISTPEMEHQKFDALVVLGRNFIPEFSHEILAEQRFHLSPVSRINALAAGIIYKAELTDTIIISGGKTAGSNMPSESGAMKEYIKMIFKDIPDEAIKLVY